MNHIFESLKKHPRTVILDTDIGPDCDDVGALVCLIHYSKKYGFPIAGICNCTSNKAGTGTIDAVCHWCGMETPYLGQWSGADFMNDASCHKYNDAVAEKYSEAYQNGTLKTVDEVTFYRTLLAKAEDDSVMIITIGMFNNLAALLESGADEISPLSGVELIKAKVNCLVSMAAILPQGRECNVICDYKASQKVFAEWPTAVYLSDFHIGWKVMTGYDHIQDPEEIAASPLSLSYHLYTKDWTHLPVKGMNSSYDLTAIQFAAEGEESFYTLLDPVDLEFYAEIPDRPDLVDATRAIPNPDGKFRFMKKLVEDQVIADSLNEILRSY
ncbi:MAG: nucleoside hydrolase [Clostridia bacterium]|nr:nucleoside hydrolase [Clostridia bacterium]